MRAIILLLFVTVVISTVRSQQFGNWQSRMPFGRQDDTNGDQIFQGNGRRNDDDDDFNSSPTRRIPFPQCLLSKSASRVLNPSSLQNMFKRKLDDGERNLRKETYQNQRQKNRGVMDYDTTELRNGESEGTKTALAALKLTQEIMTTLMCDLNGTDTQNLNAFLGNFEMPEKFCTYLAKPSCDGMTAYRTVTGVCNNVDYPYQGSSHTAFARWVSADYNDGLSEPRSRSVRGGPLPSCRRLSLAFGSKPNFDRTFNNLWVMWGLLVGNDIALSLPISDTDQTPISSCSCDSKRDYNRCTVIDIDKDDPYLRGQKCMAFPATAQAFPGQICSLGVKEQMNGNTHFIDASFLYGSTKTTAASLRANECGLLKSQKPSWSKMEIPPGQREGCSCTDGTPTRRCFAAGDSRILENGLLAGLQTMALRAHNTFAQQLCDNHPDWISLQVYEETRKIIIGIHQHIVYTKYLPKLFGDYPITFSHVGNFSQYDNTTVPVVYNEVATAAFRLHTFVRDLFSRCTSDAKLIDEVWLHDISNKVKYAYDMENNGLDAIVCGGLWDYGFAGDSNFAHQIHHRLFETTSKSGETRRNDLIAITMCRGREHGVPPYNSFRKYCGYSSAYTFEEFSDTVNYDGIQKMKKEYKDPRDVDLFFGLNVEDRSLGGGLLGPISACLLDQQFKALKFGDRFFYTHEDNFSADQLASIQNFPFYCYVCLNINIEKVPQDPFQSPYEATNPLMPCSECPAFDFSPWNSEVVPPV